MDDLGASTPFGERFLSELRARTGSTAFDYATVQRIKDMERDDILDVLRKTANLEYSTLQQLKRCETPEEMARVVHDEALRRQQAMTRLHPPIPLWPMWL